MSGPERRFEIRSDRYWGFVGGCTKEKRDEFRGTGSYPGEGGATAEPQARVPRSQ